MPATPQDRPSSSTSQRSAGSSHSKKSRRSFNTEETEPLLSQSNGEPRISHTESGTRSPAAESLLEQWRGKEKSKRRWQSAIALSTLCIVIVAIIGLVFAAPAVVEEYAKEALVFEPTNLSIDSFTTTGVRAKIEGIFVLDASKVKKRFIRTLGRAGTYLAREVESGKSKVKVYLPQYKNAMVGVAYVPPIKVNVRNGHINHISFLADLEPGNVGGVREIAQDWLDGRLSSVYVDAVALLSLRSGILSLGDQSISQSLHFEGQSLL